jgi:hypothetical protein
MTYTWVNALGATWLDSKHGLDSLIITASDRSTWIVSGSIDTLGEFDTLDAAKALYLLVRDHHTRSTT